MSELAPRRAQRRKHLDVSVLPVEQALLARAGALEAQLDVRTSGCGGRGSNYSVSSGGGGTGSVAQGNDGRAAHGGGGGGSTQLPGLYSLALAAEFRALAEELHWRG